MIEHMAKASGVIGASFALQIQVKGFFLKNQ